MSNDAKKLENEAQIILNNFKAENFAEAEIKAKQVIKKNPNFFEIYNVLGLALSRQGKVDEAINCYEKVIKLKPDFVIAHNNLGNIYNSIGEQEKAEICFFKAIEIEPRFALAYNNLGNLMKDMNRSDEALVHFKKALDYEPNLFPVLNNLAIVYQNLGNFDDAINCFHKALKINPNFSAAHRQISLIKKYIDKNDNHIKKMETIINDPKTNEEEKMHLYFGLGKANEDLKNYSKAFEYYKNGNLIKRQKLNYSEENEFNLFSKIKKTFNKKIFEKLNNSGNKDNTPIFIVGMPRSCTTLVEQILSSHKNVMGAGELNYINKIVKKFFFLKGRIDFPENLNNYEISKFNEMGDAYIEKIKKFSNTIMYISDKQPLNFRWIGVIKLILPNAKVIHCARDPRDNCLSLFKNFFPDHIKFAYDLSDITKYQNLYKDLMKHWHNVLPNQIYDISYENLVNNQEEETKKLLKFCNLVWDKNCIDFHKNKRSINTLSFFQARKPIYKDSLKLWEKYKNNLGPLLNNL